jgi:hypothetical protein
MPYLCPILTRLLAISFIPALMSKSERMFAKRLPKRSRRRLYEHLVDARHNHMSWLLSYVNMIQSNPVFTSNLCYQKRTTPLVLG